MWVKNLGCTQERTCNCGSWKNHWIHYQDGGLVHSLSASCSVVGCDGKFERGTRVKRGAGDQDCFVVPMCSEHDDQVGELLQISEGTIFVSADPRRTCGVVEVY